MWKRKEGKERKRNDSGRRKKGEDSRLWSQPLGERRRKGGKKQAGVRGRGFKGERQSRGGEREREKKGSNSFSFSSLIRLVNRLFWRSRRSHNRATSLRLSERPPREANGTGTNARRLVCSRRPVLQGAFALIAPLGYSTCVQHAKLQLHAASNVQLSLFLSLFLSLPLFSPSPFLPPSSRHHRFSRSDRFLGVSHTRVRGKATKVRSFGRCCTLVVVVVAVVVVVVVVVVVNGDDGHGRCSHGMTGYRGTWT